MKTAIKKNEKGFATIMAVIIVGAIGAAIAIGFLNKGIDATKNAVSLQNSYQARQLADTCAEIALEYIRQSTTYVGSSSSSTDVGTCSYDVTNLGGNRRNITATGVSGDSSKKVLVEIDGINPKIIIISWREIT